MFPFLATLLMILRSVLSHAKKRPSHDFQVLVKRVNLVSTQFCFHNGLLSEYSGLHGKRFHAMFCVTTIHDHVLLPQASFRSGFCLFRLQRVLKALAADLPYHLLKMIRYVIAETFLCYVEVDELFARLFHTQTHRFPTCVTSFAFSSCTAAETLRGPITSYFRHDNMA